MKRTVMICLIAAFMFTGCMMPKKDYSPVFENGSYEMIVSGSVSEKYVPEKESLRIAVSDENKDEGIRADHEDLEADDDSDGEVEVIQTVDAQPVDVATDKNANAERDGAAQFVPATDADGENAASMKANEAEERLVALAATSESAETKENLSCGNEPVSTAEEYLSKASMAQVGEKTDRDETTDESGTQAKKKKDKKKDKDAKKETAEKTFADLAPSTTMSFEELVGDNGIYGYPEAFPEAGTYRIIVDLYHQVVMAYKKDSKGKYTVPVRYMLCSSGADSSQSPTGTFKMKSYRVRYALFNNTTSYAQYWSLITGRIYFHSILYTAKDPSTYTESYKKLGTNVSHGCIRLTVPDARWIWYNCAPETEVEIRKGSKDDKDTAAIRKQLVLASYPSKRLDLKSGKAPWTDNWKISDVPQEVEFVQGSQD